MKCPHCEETLVMTERQGIEIDYCPKCRGVWLDRGELDKIIEKSVVVTTESSDDQPWRYQDDDDHHKGSRQGRKKRGGFLSNLLDFD